jgi:hypothetical protein
MGSNFIYRQQKMTFQTPTRILVDNSILNLSDTMRSVPTECVASILGQPQIDNVIAYERKPPLDASGMWMNEQRDCLPTVARLARDGLFAMYSYPELGFEACNAPKSFPANPIGRLFADISIEELETPIERSRFFQLPLDKFMTKDCMVQFCKLLIGPSSDNVANWDRIKAACSPFELSNLGKLDRFRLLCKGLGEEQFIDAFHLWTAELHKMQFFLTADKKFTKVIVLNQKLEKHCTPISPVELLKAMNISERDPFPCQLGESIGIFGQRQ